MAIFHARESRIAPIRRCLRAITFTVMTAVVLAGLAATAAVAKAPDPSPSPTPATGTDPEQGELKDQVILSGDLVVPRGSVVGEVVIFHGAALIQGVVRGGVVVLDGPVVISGQVGGSVVTLNGPVHLLPGANVAGDVRSARTVRLDEGALVQGEVREHVRLTLRGPLAVLGVLLGSIAISASVLLLGILLLLFAPRGADKIVIAAKTAPWAVAGWGVFLAVVVPVASVLAVATIVWMPLGLAVLLALAFGGLLGLTWSTWTAGRLMLPAPRSRWVAFLAGWGALTGLGLVPFLGVVVWILGSVTGLGLMAVAVWRARSTTGKHRPGYAEGPLPPPPDVGLSAS